MKIFFLFIFLFSSSLYAQDIVDGCVEVPDEMPRLDKSLKKPELGPYIKIPSYHVTAGKNDPYSEEIIFFLFMKDKDIKPNFSEFHSFFNKRYNNQEDKEVLKIIHSYFALKGIKISLEEFLDFDKENKERVLKIKEAFTLKANSEFYKVYPEDTKVKIVDNEYLLQVLLQRSNKLMKYTFSSSKAFYFKDQSEEEEWNRNIIEEVREDLLFIRDNLPKEGAPIRDFLVRSL